MIYLKWKSLDPAYNLALEETIFRSLKADHPGYFLLWQNAPSVIIGRHQVTSEVVNQDFVNKKSLPVIRRMTGGGAVYHDLGNLNFSFIKNIREEEKIDFSYFLNPVCGVLGKLGISAIISGRNDLEVAGKKISGSSQIREKGKILHHGTILYNLDQEMMNQALQINPDKFYSRGVQSHMARTANLVDLASSDFSLEQLKDLLIGCCSDTWMELEPAEIKKVKELVKNKYASWDWNYGKSPKCDVVKKKRFPWGEIAIMLQTRGCNIQSCQIKGDFFSNGDMEYFENLFRNIPLLPEQIAGILAKQDLAYWFRGCIPEIMREFFVKDLFL